MINHRNMSNDSTMIVIYCIYSNNYILGGYTVNYISVHYDYIFE